MGVGKAGQILVLQRERGQLIHNGEQLRPNEAQPFAHDDYVGIVADIAGRCAEMDDPLCLGTHLAVCVHMAP